MDNLLVIVERFAGTDDGARALLCALPLLDDRLTLATRIERVEQALDGSEVIATRVRVHIEYSDLLLQHHEYDRAREFAQKAIELSDDPVLKALSACEMGRVEISAQKHQLALDLHVHALALCEAAGLTLHVANCYGNLGICQSRLGQLEPARVSYERAIALHREVGNIRNEANCLCKLAYLGWAQRSYEESAAMYRRAISILREVGDMVFLLHALKGLALLERRKGSLDQAIQVQQEVIDGFREIGRLRDVACEGIELGRCLELSGEKQRAFEYYRACLDQGVAEDSNILRGLGLGHLGEVDDARRELHDQAIRLEELEEWLDERPW